MDRQDFYLCDPQKNTLCRKSNCGHDSESDFGCLYTSHKEFSSDGITYKVKPLAVGEHVDWVFTPVENDG